jgi:hypothetical protein
MHNALSGYADARLWRLMSLEGYTPSKEKALEPALSAEFASWRCSNLATCDGSACTLWHDERELRFAKVRPMFMHAPYAVCVPLCTAPKRCLTRRSTCARSTWRARAEGRHAPTRTGLRRFGTR